MVEFEENKKKNKKNYLSNCAVGRSNWQLIIVITNNKYIFSTNNSIKKT